MHHKDGKEGDGKLHDLVSDPITSITITRCLIIHILICCKTALLCYVVNCISRKVIRRSRVVCLGCFVA